MSNLFLFNFCDLFSSVNGVLVHSAVSKISTFSLSMDITSEQTSQIECQYIEHIKSGDYGLLKNSFGKSIPFKIITKEYDDSSKMTLNVLTNFDIIDLTMRFVLDQEQIVNFSNFTNDIATVISNWRNDAQIYFPYDVTSTTSVTFYKYLAPYEAYSIKMLLRDLIRAGKYLLNTTLVDNKFMFKFSEVPIDNIIHLTLKDTNIFKEYSLTHSDNEFNILKIYVEDLGYQPIYYRVKENGNVERLLNAATSESVTLVYTGEEDLPSSWVNKTLLPEKVKDITVKGSTDLNTALLEANKTAFSELEAQYYNHEITATVYMDTVKLDLSELDSLFSKTIYLYLDATQIKTKITKYEYSGGNTINFTFGNYRGKLTEKLRKKGII